MMQKVVVLEVIDSHVFLIAHKKLVGNVVYSIAGDPSVESEGFIGRNSSVSHNNKKNNDCGCFI